MLRAQEEEEELFKKKDTTLKWDTDSEVKYTKNLSPLIFCW
jgi:hypothetical protein